MHGAHGLAMLSNPDDYDGGEPVARQAKYAALEDCNEIYACTKRSQPAVMSAGLALAVEARVELRSLPVGRPSVSRGRRAYQDKGRRACHKP